MGYPLTHVTVSNFSFMSKLPPPCMSRCHDVTKLKICGGVQKCHEVGPSRTFLGAGVQTCHEVGLSRSFWGCRGVQKCHEVVMLQTCNFHRICVFLGCRMRFQQMKTQIVQNLGLASLARTVI